MTDLHVILPNDIDDPTAPSGGNVYDRHVCGGLADLGWRVHEHAQPGAWPRPDGAAVAGLAATLAGLPDDAVVLLDGLVASAAAGALAPEARRLTLVILVHTPLVEELPTVREAEGEALAAAAAIIATSAWTRRRLIELYTVSADAVHVAEPGVDAAAAVPGSAAGGALLCVAAVVPHKGHDVLTAALAALDDVPWTCVCVGPLDRDPVFAGRIQRDIRAAGLADRIHLVGPRTAAGVDAAYAGADLLVVPSRRETYGMVVTEALARAVPVLAADTTGLPDALGRTPAGARPGLLVPPGDPAALAGALRRWLTEADLRERLRRGAALRRADLAGWPVTAERIAEVLVRVATGART